MGETDRGRHAGAADAVDAAAATVASDGADGATASADGPWRDSKPRAGTSPGPGDLALVPIDPATYADRQPLGRGGMGTITVARDRRLGRRVAIKELRASTPTLRARFTREVLLTARLEHPAIVSVHEGGVWPTGEPFYAMRLVSGRSLDQLLRERRSLAERLALVPHVMAVADAIAYAHQQRVIHRDLKPHNVMVGEFGETVVIDWGIAKDLAAAGDDDSLPAPTLAAGSAETELGSVLGTPVYMPPEQARGEPVDERADVYAIGAMLYHVLCGQPPYRGATLDEVIAAVTQRPPPRLAERQPGLPGDLVAIVERAMARDPGDRYPSGRALADDLRRFQTGQLVGAHRYSTAELLRRWVRRHRAPVAVATIALAVGAAGAAVAIAQILDERATAEAQRAIADDRRADAESLVGFMLTDLTRKLETVDRLDLLEPVAREAIAYYERAAARGEAGSAGAGLAHTRLGDVLHVGGRVDEALSEFRTALGLLAAAGRQRPDDVELRRRESAAHNRIGDLLAARGDTDGALAAYRQGLAVADEIAARHPASTDVQLDVAFARSKIGGLLEIRGDLDAALGEHRAALAATERVADARPADRGVRRDLGFRHTRMGDVLLARGDSQAALRHYDHAREIAERLAADEPGGVREREVAVGLAKLGEVHLARGDVAAALVDYRAMLTIAERLAARDPANTLWARDLGMARTYLADALRASGDLAAAAPLYRASLAGREALAARDPGNATWQNDLANGHERVGNVDRAHGDRAAALGHYRAAQAIREGLSARDPANTDWRRGVAVGHLKLAQVLADSGDLDGAVAEARACLAIAEALAAADPSSARWQRDASAAHNVFGHMLAKKGDVAGALRELRADLAIAERMAAEQPDDPSRQAAVAASQESIGAILARRGDVAGATAAYQAALAIVEKLAAAQPGDRERADELSSLRAELAALARRVR